jgi:hypothetical protein
MTVVIPNDSDFMSVVDAVPGELFRGPTNDELERTDIPREAEELQKIPHQSDLT